MGPILALLGSLGLEGSPLEGGSYQPYYPRAPSIKIIPTLGPGVYKYDLLWAIWSPRVMQAWRNAEALVYLPTASCSFRSPRMVSWFRS